MTVTMTGYLMDVNPFDQPGVEMYKSFMKQNLDKIKK
jgi:glucose-6-phosphate isomerase